MLSHWPIRTKLSLGLGLLLAAVLALFGTAWYGLYAYRELVRSLSARSAELPLAAQIQQSVNELRITLALAKERFDFPIIEDLDDEPDTPIQWYSGDLRESFQNLLLTLDAYRAELDKSALLADSNLGDDRGERETLAEIDRVIEELDVQVSLTEWDSLVLDPDQIGRLREHADRLHELTVKLPSHLYKRLHMLASEVRSRYRTAILAAWTTLAIVIALLVASRKVFFTWFADPLHRLVEGSRQVAGGNFQHRIRIGSHDEIAELANAMNDMTDRFCEIRDDLDRQVQIRTNQVVRSEQLASVGFLAAGVSHEINNPLASIALCSESLEGRLTDLLDAAGPDRSDDVAVVQNYLKMIQREAFRCKQITEKLLDFARRGDAQRQATELRELATGVIDMVQHLGKYQDKQLDLAEGPPVIADVSAQEIKQVVLNLITNALESVDSGGQVRVSIQRRAAFAVVAVEDNGCGMTDEVRKHLFEPFFTRRRVGQGTGLGLSITHRIIEEHRGHIEAHSDGPGAGSRFVVTLPLGAGGAAAHGESAATGGPQAHDLRKSPTDEKEQRHRYQAA